MKSNRIIWGLVSLVVLITIAVSFGTMSSHSQQDTSKKQDNKQDNTGYRDLSKYAVADYDAPEPDNAIEREKRNLKNKRYDKQLLVTKKPHPETIRSEASDAEPIPPAIPSAESSLIIIGEIINSKASLSNDKTGVYSEYSVRVETVLKGDKKKSLQTGATVTMDRTGGYVQYPNGQRVLFLNDWQDLPELNGRYVLFLNDDNDQNPNYRLLTAYRLSNGKVRALDQHSRFHEFNGTSETDFIDRVLNNK